jgi:hypothetical protein
VRHLRSPARAEPARDQKDARGTLRPRTPRAAKTRRRSSAIFYRARQQALNRRPGAAQYANAVKRRKTKRTRGNLRNRKEPNAGGIEAVKAVRLMRVCVAGKCMAHVTLCARTAQCRSHDTAAARCLVTSQPRQMQKTAHPLIDIRLYFLFLSHFLHFLFIFDIFSLTHFQPFDTSDIFHFRSSFSLYFHYSFHSIITDELSDTYIISIAFIQS